MEKKIHVIPLFVILAGLASISWPANGSSRGSALQHMNHGDPSRSGEPVCRKDFCRCTWTRADCSGNYGRLKYVPELPDGIRTLYFSYNNLTRISRDNFFHNVTRIVVLALNDNGLEYISQGAFRGLTALKTLYLGYNSLTYKAITPVFWAERLSDLHLPYMGLGQIPDDWFKQKPVPPLLKLDLAGNRLQHLDFSALSTLDKLGHLIVTNSRVDTITSSHSPQLTRLELQSNALYDFPESCRNGTSMFPKLQELSFAQNKFSAFSRHVCLPKLEFLELSRNPMEVLKTDMFNSHRFPNLIRLSMEFVVTLSKLERFAFRSPTLRKLSLMHCEISFRSACVHPDSFAGLSHLEYLQMGHNMGNDIPEEKFSRLFGSLKNERHFFMGGNDLYSISKKTFAGLTSLERIDMYLNKIREIPDGTFDALKNLTDLNLNDNQITVVHEATFSNATRMRLRHFDLSNNPFVCNCDLLWFQKWFLSSPPLFGKYYGNYTCENMNNLPLKSFILNEQACVFSPGTNQILIACALILLSLLLFASVVYQYRWHIRLLLAFRGHSQIMRRRLLVENFTYDVFLSYAEEDEVWILQHLLPHLEGRQGLRVCFHKRDFLPGRNILDNIVDSVKGSKKFVLVFSKHFAKSRWCQFELDLCLGHVLDNDDALVVLLLDDASSRDLTSTMTAVLQTTTYIRWEERPHVIDSFWRRLELSLREILP